MNVIFFTVMLSYLPKIYFGLNIPAITAPFIFLYHLSKSRRYLNNDGCRVIFVTTLLFTACLPSFLHSFSSGAIKQIIGLVYFPLLVVLLSNQTNLHFPRRGYFSFAGLLFGYSIYQYIVGPNFYEVAYLDNFGASLNEFIQLGEFRAGSLVGDPITFSYIMLLYATVFIGTSGLVGKLLAVLFTLSAFTSLTRSSFLILVSGASIRLWYLGPIVGGILYIYIVPFLDDMFYLSIIMRLNSIYNLFSQGNIFVGTPTSTLQNLGITPRDLGVFFVVLAQFGLAAALIYIGLLLQLIFYIKRRMGTPIYISLMALSPNIVTFSLDTEVLAYFIALTLYYYGARTIGS